MRSLSTSALGQPSETKLTLGVVGLSLVAGSCTGEGLAVIGGEIKLRIPAWKGAVSRHNERSETTMRPLTDGVSYLFRNASASL